MSEPLLDDYNSMKQRKMSSLNKENQDVNSLPLASALGGHTTLEKIVEDRKMFFTMMCAVSYVTSLSITCAYFTGNTEAFTGSPDNTAEGPIYGCYAKSDSDLPVDQSDPDATNVAE